MGSRRLTRPNYKVLHLRSSGALLGAENVILEIAKNSSEFGYHSVVGAIKNKKDNPPEFLTVAEKYDLETICFESHAFISLACGRNIREFVKSNKINLLHTHGYKENFYSYLSNAIVPKLATNHLWKTNTLRLRLYRIFDSLLMKKFNSVTGVSDEIVAEMNNLGIKGAIKIQNGIDINKFNMDPKDDRLVREFGLSPKAIIFGMISSLTFEKNHAIVIDSLAKLNNEKIQLLIVGDGPLLNKLQAQVSQLGLADNVFFVGRKNNIREILSITDVFLLPSLREGLPMALLEAMACGKAVIVSRVGENPHVIEHNVNGLLVEPNDQTSLVKSMQFYIEHNERINIFGKLARKTVENNFSSLAMTRKYCQLYDRLIKRDS